MFMLSVLLQDVDNRDDFFVVVRFVTNESSLQVLSRRCR